MLSHVAILAQASLTPDCLVPTHPLLNACLFFSDLTRIRSLYPRQEQFKPTICQAKERHQLGITKAKDH